MPAETKSLDYSFDGARQALHFGMDRVGALYPGEKLALGALAAAVIIGCMAAFNRLLAGEFSWPKTRKILKTPKRKKGFGLRWVALVLVALLPGGLVGTFAVYAILGKEMWRRDAIWILGISLLPMFLLLGLRQDFFPWPEFRDELFVSGSIGLAFGLLQLWVTLKLLREWFGEPEECVPWWPPAALCLQFLMFAGCAFWMLTQ